ncbi:hypothetical protein NX059_012285 [Plenodomus lindquistii]|nr:hypothetical protein NX059_012285 [Plenodomus lindquistii]
MDLLWRNDIDPKKVVMGMGFYGCSFTLSDPSCKTPGCGFSAGGKLGMFSASAGSLMFSEIKEIVDAGADVVHDEKTGVKMVIWALAKTAGKLNLSVSTLAKTARNDPRQCVWGECGANCPSGLIPVSQSSGDKNPLGIELGCTEGKRNFCCPSKDPPTTDGCWTGHKSLCCTKTTSTDVLDACKWFGAAPICTLKSFVPSLFGPLGGAFSFPSKVKEGSKAAPITEVSRVYVAKTQSRGRVANGELSQNQTTDPFAAPPSSHTEHVRDRRAGSTTWIQWEKLLAGPIGNLFLDSSTECKTGCEPGETTVATDGHPCRKRADVELCYGPSHLDQLESGPEAESNLPNVFEEEHRFDRECGTADTTRLLRGRDQVVDLSNSSMVFLARGPTREELSSTSELLGTRDLAKHGARERVPMSLCDPRGQKSSIWVQRHPSVSTIIRTTSKAWTVAQ